jgi:SAM-dependent methyltransferase
VRRGVSTAPAEYAERLSEDGAALPPTDWFLHQARYLFATRFTRGREVLDLACGSGYGSALIARYGARSVTGVDISPAAIDEARSRYDVPNVRFVEGDALAARVDGPFDVAVSFETIEHVDDPGRALDELARVLAPGGVLVCSSPNRDLTNPRGTRTDPPPNPFHRVELSRAELRRELELRFRDVRLYGQAYRPPAPRLLRRAGEPLFWATAWPVRLPLKPLYVVAVCRRPR